MVVVFFFTLYLEIVSSISSIFERESCLKREIPVTCLYACQNGYAKCCKLNVVLFEGVIYILKFQAVASTVWHIMVIEADVMNDKLERVTYACDALVEVLVYLKKSETNLKLFHKAFSGMEVVVSSSENAVAHFSISRPDKGEGRVIIIYAVAVKPHA